MHLPLLFTFQSLLIFFQCSKGFGAEDEDRDHRNPRHKSRSNVSLFPDYAGLGYGAKHDRTQQEDLQDEFNFLCIVVLGVPILVL